MLPFEDDVRHEIEAAASTELTESRELLQLALNMIGCDEFGNLNVPSTPVHGVGNWARTFALGLYAKACKQFRTVILVGEAGFESEMAVLTRSLFETALALEFLMKESIVLKQDGKNVVIDASRPLTTDFRTLLYGARVAQIAEKRLREWRERPEIRDNKQAMALLGDPAEIAREAAAARSTVGELWWKALKQGPAGLKVKYLAESLGVPAYYVMVYGDQSEVAHAGDAYKHFDVPSGESNGTLDLSPTSDSIGGRLRLASLLFLGCLTSVHNRLQFGDSTERALNTFAERLGVKSGA